jgi:hypothetical protein
MLSFPFYIRYSFSPWDLHKKEEEEEEEEEYESHVLSHSQAVMADNNKQWATSFGKRRTGRRLAVRCLMLAGLESTFVFG